MWMDLTPASGRNGACFARCRRQRRAQNQSTPLTTSMNAWTQGALVAQLQTRGAPCGMHRTSAGARDTSSTRSKCSRQPQPEHNCSGRGHAPLPKCHLGEVSSAWAPGADPPSSIGMCSERGSSYERHPDNEDTELLPPEHPDRHTVPPSHSGAHRGRGGLAASTPLPASVRALTHTNARTSATVSP